ncbi:hypothetical protein ACS0TY_021846 [Phlomoides rotata]
MYCQVIPSEEISNEIGVDVIKFLVRSIVNDSFLKEYTYTISKIEFKGILCCHILLVLAQKNIQTVNERYVLRRWGEDVNQRYYNIFFVGGYPHLTEEYKKIQEVEKKFQQCIEIPMGSPKKLEFIKESCNEMKNALKTVVKVEVDEVILEVDNHVAEVLVVVEKTEV